MLIKDENKIRLLNYFKDNLINSKIEQCVMDKNILKFFYLIFNLNKNNYKKIFLLFFIIMPFGNYMYRKLKKSW